MNTIEKVNELLSMTSKIEDGRIKFLPVEAYLDQEVVIDYARRGKWSLVHFAGRAGGLGTKAIRVVPWLPSNQWPVGGSMRYYESAFQYRSMNDYLVQGELRFILNNRENILERKNEFKLFEAAQKPVFELFDCLDGWKTLSEWIHNEENWPDADLSKEEKQRRERELFLRFDSSLESTLFLNLMDQLQNDKYLPEVPNFDLGFYEERILSAISYRAGMRVFDEPMEKLEELLIQSVKYAHGFGTEDDDLRLRVSMSETSMKVFEAIEALFSPYMTGEVSQKIKDMPEFYIAEAMNKQKRGYNGIAHIEVAALMDDQLNDPKKAWKYLQAASYWVGENMPEAQGAVLEAAMHLCGKHGWNEALEVLEYNKRMMET